MNFKAYYDVSKDRIINANPYTYEWFHERRHQKQFNSIRWLNSLNRGLETLTYGISAGFLLSILLYTLPFNAAVFGMGLTNIPYALVNLTLELDAMIFGTYEWLKHKRKV